MREEEAEQIVQNFLAHHGVLGMKWGVRRAKESPEQKIFRKAAQKNFSQNIKGKGQAIDRRFDRFFDQGITKEQYDALGTKDVTYAKGKQLYRLTKDPNLAKGKDLGLTYVSTNKKDAEIYRAVLPVGESLFAGSKKEYQGWSEITFTATKKLVSPSEKARVDAFIDLMDQPKVVLKNGKVVTGREFLKRSGLGYEVKRLDSTQAGLKMYNKIATEQWKQTPLNSAYFNSLREKGYNAVIDDNDRNIITKDPLMVLDPKGNLKTTKIRQLTTNEILSSQANYRDIINP